jgi:phage terminase large subunit-like protein
VAFCETRAAHAVNFIERVLTHTKAEWAGQPFVLDDWQRDEIIRPLFGTVIELPGVALYDCPRQYRTAFVEIPRKNGKSEIAAAVALYLLLADGEPGAEIYGAAYTRDQASLVFNVARDMVRQSALLRKRTKIIDSQKRILVPATGNIYRAIPADASASHGFNAHGVVVDEVHTQANRDLWDVLTTSTGVRRQPLVFAITTAGKNRNTICYELHEHALKVIDGIIEDPSFFAYVKAAPEDADWRDEKVWFAANPALGRFRKIDELRDMARRAEQVPALENTFRNLYLNQWTAQETRWLPMIAWDECKGEARFDKTRPVYAGLDMANTTDVTALVLAQPPAESGGRFNVQAHFFIPGDNIADRVRRDRVPYDLWQRKGWLTTTEGNVVDYRTIRQSIEALGARIAELAYDSWGAVQLAQELEDSGLIVIPFQQGYKSLSPPTKELLNLVIGHRLEHDGNPVLRWMADNLIVELDAAGNVKPSKRKSTEKIDGIVALVMALDRATRHEDVQSVYERRGLLTL